MLYNIFKSASVYTQIKSIYITIMVCIEYNAVLIGGDTSASTNSFTFPPR